MVRDGPRRDHGRRAEPALGPSLAAPAGGGAGLRPPRPSHRAVRRLLLLSVPSQLQVDALPDAARSRAPRPLRRAAPDLADHLFDAIHPEPAHDGRLRDHGRADEHPAGWPWPWRRTPAQGHGRLPGDLLLHRCEFGGRGLRRLRHLLQPRRGRPVALARDQPDPAGARARPGRCRRWLSSPSGSSSDCPSSS